MSKRNIATGSALALALGIGSEAAPAAPPHNASHAAAAVAACHSAPTAGGRYVTFVSRMSLLPRTASMAVRFDVYARPARSGSFRRVSAPGLGNWHTSAPRVMVFAYHQSVTNLPAPAGFRAQVSFRWRDAKSHVIHRAHRRTGVCRLSDPRPHLVLDAVTRLPTLDPTTTDYRAVVANLGASPAGAFDVGLKVGGVSQPSLTVAALIPGQRAQVDFLAPRCRAGASFTVAVDPERRTDQSTRAGSSRTASC